MDKILITAFFSALAGLIAAIMAIVKLINEKEGKTSQYRQEWTISVRNCLANLVAKINSLSRSMLYLKKLSAKIDALYKIEPKSEKESTKVSKAIDFIENRINQVQDDILVTRKEIHEAFAQASLHFKPNDDSFKPVEEVFAKIMALFYGMGEKTEPAEVEKDILLLKKLSDDINNACRVILKQVWEDIKKGEPTYITTKRWAFVSVAVMTVILFVIGWFSIPLIENTKSMNCNDAISIKNTLITKPEASNVVNVKEDSAKKVSKEVTNTKKLE